nr:MAG TPA: hypothetical protein [Caudoviricetes sp.]
MRLYKIPIYIRSYTRNRYLGLWLCLSLGVISIFRTDSSSLHKLCDTNSLYR